jgi:hypothetical protein
LLTTLNKITEQVAIAKNNSPMNGVNSGTVGEKFAVIELGVGVGGDCVLADSIFEYDWYCPESPTWS